MHPGSERGGGEEGELALRTYKSHPLRAGLPLCHQPHLPEPVSSSVHEIATYPTELSPGLGILYTGH